MVEQMHFPLSLFFLPLFSCFSFSLFLSLSLYLILYLCLSFSLVSLAVFFIDNSHGVRIRISTMCTATALRSPWSCHAVNSPRHLSSLGNGHITSRLYLLICNRSFSLSLSLSLFLFLFLFLSFSFSALWLLLINFVFR